MKVFVTGGTGFLGSHLINGLLSEGVEVFALLRDPKKPGWLAGLNVHILNGNLFSIPTLPRDLDMVYHLAGLAKSTRTAEYYNVNHLGTASLLDALKHQGLKPRFVHVSSISAGGPSPQGHFRREDETPSPVSPYGRSKLLAENAVLRSSQEMQVTVLRPAVIFGPRDKDLLELLKIIKRGIMPLMHSVGFHVSYIYIKDVVKGMLQFLHHPPRSGEIYNLAASDSPDMLSLSRKAASLMGRRILPIRIPFQVSLLISLAAGALSWLTGSRPTLNRSLYLEMRHLNWAVDTGKAAKELSFSAETPFEEAMKETLSWYQEKGWL